MRVAPCTPIHVNNTKTTTNTSNNGGSAESGNTASHLPFSSAFVKYYFEFLESGTPESMEKVYQFILLTNGECIHEKHPQNGWVIFHYLVSQDNVSFFQRIRSFVNTCQISVRNSYGRTPIMLACLYANMNTVKYLIEEFSIDVLEQTSDDHKNCLDFAKMRNEEKNKQLVSYLQPIIQEKQAQVLKNKSSDSISNLERPKSPIQLIIQHEMEKGEWNDEVKLMSPRFARSIFQATKRGELAIVRALIATDPSLAEIKHLIGFNPLHFASLYGHLTIVKYLCEQIEVNVNTQTDREGFTCLHLAAMNGRLDVCQYLVEIACIHMDTKDNEGCSALTRAKECGQSKIVNYLQVQNIERYEKKLKKKEIIVLDQQLLQQPPPPPKHELLDKELDIIKEQEIVSKFITQFHAMIPSLTPNASG